MNEQMVPPSADVIVGVDGSEGSYAALCWAVQTASLHGYAVRAVLAADAQPIHPECCRGTPVPELRHILGDAYVLHSTVRRADAPEWIPIAEHVTTGSPADVLVSEADGAAMLVVGRSHQGSGNRWAYRPALGLTCARTGAVPTVVVRDRPDAVDLADAQPVVVGVDSSSASLVALRWAAHEASLRRTRLVVLHIWPAAVLARPSVAVSDQEPPNTELFDLPRARRFDFRGFRWPETEDQLVFGDAADALLGAAEHSQLLVLGGPSPTAEASHALRRVSERCVREAACTVAVVPGLRVDVAGADRRPDHLEATAGK
jgi:nucleotide-binding universal stress UspA family protein